MPKDCRVQLRIFSSAIELKKLQIDAYYRRGYLLKFYKLNDSVGALEDFNNAIKIKSKMQLWIIIIEERKVQNTYNALQDLIKLDSAQNEALY
jgi:hypothetical protein